MISYRFLRQAGPALGFGCLMALASSVGQTYFISLFAGEMRIEMNLSHTEFGGLYSLATLASAGVLVWLGKFADKFDLVQLSMQVVRRCWHWVWNGW